ncbi:MAG TPA: sugar ABC transporter substrate-binding protein [Thermoanaerobaculia bacterium]|nr:sugar ABC transporter substrate-binding protein [Thermoanaerobaculia bacterium]
MSGRRVRAALGLLAVVSGVAGTASCSGRSDGRTTVRFWAFGREGEEVRALVPEFERRNPDLHIDVQQVPWTAAHEKLLTAYVGDALPDAAQMGNTWIPEMAALSALAPLSARIAKSKSFDRVDSFAGVWDSNEVDGELWGVPWYVDTRVIFYRTDLIEQAHAPWPPKSWDEWRTAMGRVRALSPDHFAILLPIDEWSQPMMLGLQLGAPLLKDGGRHGGFSEPRFRAALAFFAGIFSSGFAPPLDQSGLANLYQQFEEGYYAMFISGPWNLTEMKNRLPADMQDHWSTAPLPPPDAASEYPGTSLAGGASLVVFRGAANPEGAWRWLEFLSEPAQQAEFYRRAGDLPSRRSAWKTTGLADDPRAAAFLTQLGRVAPSPKVPEWEQIGARLAVATEQVVRGARDLDGALQALDTDADRILEKRRFLLDRTASLASKERKR